MDKRNNKDAELKSYEAFFDSVSLELYHYAVFSLKDEKGAEDAVRYAYVAGYKSFLSGNSKDMESILFKIISQLLVKNNDDVIKRCAVYLLFKLKFKLEKAASILSLSPFCMKEILNNVISSVRTAV